MKAYRIKKRSHRQAFFIAGESVTSFKKPKIPYRFFDNVHPPALFKRGVGQAVFAEAMSERAEEQFVAVAAESARVRAASLALESQHLVVASGNSPKVV